MSVPGSNPGFLLGGRTSASAESRHWSGRAVRWSSCAILLRKNVIADRDDDRRQLRRHPQPGGAQPLITSTLRNCPRITSATLASSPSSTSTIWTNRLSAWARSSAASRASSKLGNGPQTLPPHWMTQPSQLPEVLTLNSIMAVADKEKSPAIGSPGGGDDMWTMTPIETAILLSVVVTAAALLM